MFMKPLVLSLCLLGLPFAVHAQQERVYWGFSLLNASVNENQLKEDRIAYVRSDMGWTDVHSWRNDNDGGLKLYRGVVNDQYWATEVGVAFMGQTSWETRAQGNARLYEYRRTNALFYDKVRYWGGTDHLRLFGRFGLAITDTTVDGDWNDAGGWGNYSASETELNPKLGLGVQYRLNNAFHFRAEFERYFNVGYARDRTGEADIDVVSFGLVKLF
jgi:hypothetical protein